MTPAQIRRRDILRQNYILPLMDSAQWRADVQNQSVIPFREITWRHMKTANVSLSDRAYIYASLWAALGNDTQALLAMAEPGSEMHKALETERCRPTTPKEITMTSPTQCADASMPRAEVFETRHYVFGTDVRRMSENDLIAAIKTAEGEINSLHGVRVKSTNVEARIAALQVMVDKIAEILDAR